jgi:hypothetical protein
VRTKETLNRCVKEFVWPVRTATFNKFFEIYIPQKFLRIKRPMPPVVRHKTFSYVLLTSQITGGKKQSDGGAVLFAVRVHLPCYAIPANWLSPAHMIISPNTFNIHWEPLFVVTPVFILGELNGFS